LEIGYLYFKNYVLEPLNADVFIHTWSEKNYQHTPGSRRLNTNSYPPCLNFDMNDFIENHIKPKKFIIEDSDSFWTQNVPSSDQSWNSNRGMLHSWKTANLLRKEYESDLNFKYDLIVKARFDQIPHKFVRPKELDIQNKMYVSAHVSRNHYDWAIRNSMVTDGIAISNGSNMDIYCNSLDLFLSKGFKSETLLFHQLNNHGVRIDFIDLGLKLVETYNDKEFKSTSPV
jgi:hypothetical protein